MNRYILYAFCLLFLFCGCGSEKQSSENKNSKKPVAKKKPSFRKDYKKTIRFPNPKPKSIEVFSKDIIKRHAHFDVPSYDVSDDGNTAALYTFRSDGKEKIKQPIIAIWRFGKKTKKYKLKNKPLYVGHMVRLSHDGKMILIAPDPLKSVSVYKKTDEYKIHLINDTGETIHSEDLCPKIRQMLPPGLEEDIGGLATVDNIIWLPSNRELIISVNGHKKRITKKTRTALYVTNDNFYYKFSYDIDTKQLKKLDLRKGYFSRNGKLFIYENPKSKGYIIQDFENKKEIGTIPFYNIRISRSGKFAFNSKLFIAPHDIACRRESAYYMNDLKQMKKISWKLDYRYDLFAADDSMIFMWTDNSIRRFSVKDFEPFEIINDLNEYNPFVIE